MGREPGPELRAAPMEGARGEVTMPMRENDYLWIFTTHLSDGVYDEMTVDLRHIVAWRRGPDPKSSVMFRLAGSSTWEEALVMPFEKFNRLVRAAREGRLDREDY